jgi:exonuclease I
MARLRVTGLNAAKRKDGEPAATFAKAASMAKMLHRKNQDFRQVMMATAAMANFESADQREQFDWHVRRSEHRAFINVIEKQFRNQTLPQPNKRDGQAGT